MEDKKSDQTNLDTMIQDWMKASADFWTSMIKDLPAAAPAFKVPETGGEIKNRYIEAMETALKRMQSAAAAINDPQVADAVLKGLNTMPEIILKVAKTGWEASLRLQKQAMDKAGKIGQKTEAYKFENLEEDVFKLWREIYEEEFRQYFRIPQLGLARYYQERLHRLADQANVLNAALSEFLYLLYLPMEKSVQVLQDKVEELAKEGKVPDKAKEYYNLWVKILEGHYMNLFKSPEYLAAFREMLDQAEIYVQAKNEVLQDVLQSLPVPTNRDMDNVYKDLYLLKKRVRALEKELAGKGKERK
ncbi:MAG TPA: poly(R)-hydroxyalkanoic acid synthase subunit PhaE [Syntrophales bacterium]|jgi:class III poly(R)-hydroxyalkanoic acid synthase PhaE subunit|nr:poly(R)-hydroxyalkanoic acid synthase subunit PhaE [Syntrophales bacterium]HON24001.1 poly(R)-hydroxyalkanoic acid synthase subunit PhaE [Syntrophales bacterium]HOU77349.1 poly(R)-hydroxyalkanoic acid synthase subunit PhaE [Syntrophales bacterium]HPC32648.1 poly(R)-hydroxyalkanoic acid synthase subunit PhaE [Syntrophales bacterium]HQG33962.1 poly(R)-hydroxyalkanoic acid synthase subunit PhaE [Syntrophales bacterium]